MHQTQHKTLSTVENNVTILLTLLLYRYLATLSTSVFYCFQILYYTYYIFTIIFFTATTALYLTERFYVRYNSFCFRLMCIFIIYFPTFYSLRSQRGLMFLFTFFVFFQLFTFNSRAFSASER